MPPTLHISLLGPLRVRVGQATAHFRTDAQRVLLAYLAAHQGVPQRRDTLAGLLSPDRPDPEALTYLRNRLTLLRGALGDDTAAPPWFEADRKQIALRAGEDVVVDVIQFEQLLARVEGHAHRQLAGCPVCLARLQEAVDLLRGELLAGLNFPSDTWEAWLLAQREHVRQRALAALTRLREARLARGEWAAVAAVAQRQLGLEPWLEAAHRALMRAYYQLGDRNAALAQFEQCRQLLQDELGVAPEAETQRLWRQIFDQTLVVAAGAPIADNLPRPVGLFFGREAEQAQLLQRLVDPHYRLVSLVGAGGMGKTRLAIEVGRQVRAAFPDGVWFVALESEETQRARRRGGERGGEAEAIQIAIGEAVGLGQAGQQLTGEQVLAILRDKQLLLILDNCEAALDDLAFIPAWLRRAPRLAVLATSREPLAFQAESVVLLGGLPVGEGATSAAEALFAERGRMARADFAVPAEAQPLVRQICARLDGSPLAIALAAAWVRHRSPAEIRDEIGRSLDFLSSPLRDGDPRHRSLRAVFESSWQLLTPAEQRVLAALAVFPATFSAAAAEQVAGASRSDLDRLGEKSLLQQQPEAARYGLHNLVRQFAADKPAADRPAIERAFVDHFRHFARDYQANYAALRPEWGNLLAAVAKAHELAAWPLVLELTQVLDKAWFRQIRFHDMRQGLGLALAAAEALPDEPAQARLRLRLAEIEMELNAYAAATAHLAAALPQLTHLEDSWGIAQANYLSGRIKNEQARDDEALALFEASRRIFAEAGDWLGVAKNLNLIAVGHVKKHRDFAAAQAYLEQARDLQQRRPLSSTYVETLRNLARVRGWTGDPTTAESYLIEAAEVSRQLGDVGEYAAVLYERVLLGKRQGQFAEALAFGNECLATFRQLGSLRWEALLKTQLGLLHQAQQDAPQAIALLNEGLELFQELGDLYEQAYSYYYLSALYAETGQAASSLWAKEQARRINQAVNDPQLSERLAL
jgi:predicted ATPase/DNA-binding SARP family transcriptional activator